jgi:hypothetical protein
VNIAIGGRQPLTLNISATTIQTLLFLLLAPVIPAHAGILQHGKVHNLSATVPQVLIAWAIEKIEVLRFQPWTN